ncbi:C4-dicarboxylate ABC transporter permease [Microvirga vignae]|uniref:TRAP transporter small permease protein n=2 Tax=Microvirga vignae TaxID=1225564 RepID=A0A0H1R864_9HYPH|nr:TRAP transporter small permease [Microvirga vignae]KLK91284.1 C4-dicarboxylate ABC transporter permease [Microvirga vignae]
MPIRVVTSLSNGLLAVERFAIMGLMALLTLLILVNVSTRYAGLPIYWIDESAVYATVWLTFIGASAMTRLRLDFAVTMLTERLSPRGQQIARIISALAVVGFGFGLGIMCWLWMDPIGIARAGFDAKTYAGETFNFLYTEQTQTLNWPSWVVYLTLPIFAVSMTLHGLANTLEDLGIAEKSAFPGFHATTSDGIN